MLIFQCVYKLNKNNRKRTKKNLKEVLFSIVFIQLGHFGQGLVTNTNPTLEKKFFQRCNRIQWFHVDYPPWN